MKEDDYREFAKAMIKEISKYVARYHWTMMERRALLRGVKTIMSIWSFKQNGYPNGELNKHKACICTHGGQQIWGQNYCKTYAPVVNWASVRLLLADFVLAFPQADLEVPAYMELPVGFEYTDDSNRKKYILRLNVSLYALK